MKKELLKLAKMILKLSQTETINGVVLIADSELVEGIEVFVESEEGNELIPAADGTYETENLIIEIAEGKVISIKEKEVEEEPKVEEEVKEELVEEVNELDELNKKIAEYEATIAELEASIIEKDQKIAELEEAIKEKEEKAVEEFNNQKPAFKDNSEQVEVHKNLAEIAREVYG